jgi:predicted RNase H-like nuclease (RuvC/YqgF family)
MSKRARSQPVLSLFAFQDIITSVTGIMILVTLFLALELVSRKEGSAAATSRLTDEMQQAIEDANALEAQIEKNRKHIKHLESELQKGRGDLDALASTSTDTLKNERTALRQQVEGARRRKNLTIEQRQRIAVALREVTDDLGSSGISDDAIARLEQAIATTEQQIGDVTAVSLIVKPAPDEKRTPVVVQVSGQAIAVATDGPSGSVNSYQNPQEVSNQLRKLDASTHYVVILIKPSGIKNFREVYDSAERLGFSIARKLLGQTQTAIAAPRIGSAP